jgi:hypothetical protein
LAASGHSRTLFSDKPNKLCYAGATSPIGRVALETPHIFARERVGQVPYQWVGIETMNRTAEIAFFVLSLFALCLTSPGWPPLPHRFRPVAKHGIRAWSIRPGRAFSASKPMNNRNPKNYRARGD